MDCRGNKEIEENMEQFIGAVVLGLILLGGYALAGGLGVLIVICFLAGVMLK